MRFACAALLGIAAGAPAYASPCPISPRTAAGVRSMENAWVSALERHDRAALDCILDPSFVDSNWRGQRVTKTEMLAGFAKRPSPTLRLTDVEVVLLGDVGIVRGVNTQKSADGGNSGSVRFTDVFAYRQGRWRAISAQETVIQNPANTAGSRL